MNAITYTAARENLSSTMDRVCDDHEPVIITRHRKPAVVMMSREDYSSHEETAYLMRSPANALRLLNRSGKLKAGTLSGRSSVSSSMNDRHSYGGSA